MRQDADRSNLINYILAHTSIEAAWNHPGRLGLCPFRALQTADAAQFVKLVREHPPAVPGFNPLDGQTHDLIDLRNWLWPAVPTPTAFEWALRLIVLGLGLFEVEPDTWYVDKRPDRSFPVKSPEVLVEQKSWAGEKCRFRYQG